MKNTVVIITLSFFTCLSYYGQNNYKYTQPKQLADGWKTNSIRSKNIDTTRVFNLFNQLKNKKNKIHSLLLIKDEQLFIEEYFNGHSTNKPHDLRSTTKSIKSILIGIAINEGFIDNVNDPISKYLKSNVSKKNLDKRKEKITIKHLLTMSSGLDCNDWDKKSKGQEDKVYKKKNWLQYTLDLPMVNDPGEVSNYCSMGTILLAEIINQSSGLTIDKFAEKYLFTPLNIDNVYWGHTLNKEIIPSGKRLYMTSRDMAKIGLLILNKGKWNEKQIVSRKWIEDSTSPKTKITKIDYGYLWWNLPLNVNEKTVNSIVATGNGGQYILVIPEMNMIAIFTGGAYNSQEDKLAFAIMNRILLPTFDSK